MTSNIPSKPAYGVYNISQLVHIGRICSSFGQFKDKHYRLTSKLMGLVIYVRLSRDLQDIIKILFSKYKCSVRRHIEEGVCLPLSVATLSRHITTRPR